MQPINTIEQLFSFRSFNLNTHTHAFNLTALFTHSSHDFINPASLNHSPFPPPQMSFSSCLIGILTREIGREGVSGRKMLKTMTVVLQKKNHTHEHHHINTHNSDNNIALMSSRHSTSRKTGPFQHSPTNSSIHTQPNSSDSQTLWFMPTITTYKLMVRPTFSSVRLLLGWGSSCSLYTSSSSSPSSSWNNGTENTYSYTRTNYLLHLTWEEGNWLHKNSVYYWISLPSADICIKQPLLSCHLIWQHHFDCTCPKSLIAPEKYWAWA